ncbi:MAG: SH3 domain-containing protein [Treponema sp.]|nr:SH3 domain-containing protein [Treponema sp.]
MSTKCPECGNDNETSSGVCKACGAVLAPGQTTANPVADVDAVPKYKNLKEFSDSLVGDSSVKRVRIAGAILCICGTISIIAAAVLRDLLEEYSDEILFPIMFIEAFLILAMGIWLLMTYSPVAATCAFVLMLLESICGIAFPPHRIQWGAIVACVNCALAIGATEELSNAYKSFRKGNYKHRNYEADRQYAEEQEKLRKEMFSSVSLKDGYKFASVPGRFFAEKINLSGSYCCPYCYAEVSSDVASMCGTCGKSLGLPQGMNLSKISSDVASMCGTGGKSMEIVQEKKEEKVFSVDENLKKENFLLKNKKLFLGIGIGVAILAVVIIVIFKVNSGTSYKQEVSNNAEVQEVGSKTGSAEVSNNTKDENNHVTSDLTLRCTNNLRLRASDNTDSPIITTMNAGTMVKILKLGREDENNGVVSYWVLVEVLPGGKDRDLNRIPDGTQGWCFGGFLEP